MNRLPLDRLAARSTTESRRFAPRRPVADSSVRRGIATRMVCIVASIACVIAGTAASRAAPTDPDPAWGTLGVANLPTGTAQVLGLQALADGSALVAINASVDGAVTSRVIRLGPSGQPDAGFAGTGSIDEPKSVPYPGFGGMAVRADGRLSVLWLGGTFQPAPNFVYCDRVFGRYLASGLPDPSFGTNGERVVLEAACAFGHVLDSLGTSYGYSNQGGAFPRTWLVRTAADGTELPYTPPPVDTSAFGFSSLTIDAADRMVLGLFRRDGARSRFFIGRSGAPAFGNGGVADIDVYGESWLQGAFGLADGRVVAFGWTASATPDPVRQPVVARFTANGVPDPTFGAGGLVVLPLATFTEPGADRVRVLAQPDGRLVAVVDIKTAPGPDAPYRVVLARLRPDGRLDDTFAPGGVAELPLGDARLARGVWNELAESAPALRPGGEIVLPLSLRDGDGVEALVVLQLQGGDLPAPLPFGIRAAVEYFHAGYGHYFVTADADEIAHLDATVASGWQRTGRSFDVFAGGGAPLVPVCRFWSDQTFAPKSSHFYTPYAAECATVKQSPDWLFERDAFALRLPVGAAGARECPVGTTRLYRAYNGMLTGAPNHRYTTDPAVLDAMIAQGWTMEGEAATRVFACVPLQ